MKRVFVGIPISNKLQAAISQWREEHQDLPVRWLSDKNLHITLVPPWYESDTQAVIKKLKEVSCEPFTIKFDSVSFGPNPTSPRLIWASGQAPGPIIFLKNSLEKVLQVPSEKRKLILHATLARFRPEAYKFFSLQVLNNPVRWEMEVKSFALYESRLSPWGAEYEMLEEFELD